MRRAQLIFSIWSVAVVSTAAESRAWAAFNDLTVESAQATFVGEGANEQAGWSVSLLGDFDADGYGDFLIGAQLNDDGGVDSGKIYLVLGQPYGYSGRYALELADGLFVGERSEDYAGAALSGAGDVDGDGYDDFLIGAWGNDQAGGAAGKVYLYYGGSSAPSFQLLSAAPASFVGENSGDVAGYALSRAGDFNHDGYDDFLIGAPNNDGGGNNAGRVYLLLGSATRYAGLLKLSAASAFFQGETANDRFGYALGGGVDVSGDGLPEIAVGAYGNDRGGSEAGAAYLFSAPAPAPD